jgi:hypothetical protein
MDNISGNGSWFSQDQVEEIEKLDEGVRRPPYEPLKTDSLVKFTEEVRNKYKIYHKKVLNDALINLDRAVTILNNELG